MRRTGWTLLALLFGVQAAAFAQGDQNFPIDAAYRARIVDGVATKLDQGYFDGAQGALINAQLHKRVVRAAYDTCGTAASISAALTRDLQKWSHDRHLRVVFSATPHPMTGAQAQADAEEAEGRARNFGFYQITRFTGNVGYLELGRFFPAALAGTTLEAAMQFLSNTDALIVDLRGNGGGHADMVALMTSYFLKDQQRLATLERRDPAANDQVWSASFIAGPRYLGKPVYILTSGRTFSAAEGLTYDLKNLAGATVVGEKTRGGANPGSFQQIDEHFAVFVPTARVVHAATGTNWDADGIAPDVSVPAAEASRTALELALQHLVSGKPDDPHFAMWKGALDEMFPAAKR